MSRWTSLAGALLIGIFIGTLLPARTQSVRAQSESAGTSEEKIAWYFYRVKWGHQDEFLELYKKNHYPVMKAQLGGRLTDFKAFVPSYHGDGRADWTFASVLTAQTVRSLGPGLQATKPDRFTAADAQPVVPILDPTEPCLDLLLADLRGSSIGHQHALLLHRVYPGKPTDRLIEINGTRRLARA